MVVGAPATDNSGYARVYNYNWVTTTWEQLGSDLEGDAAGDQTGWSVAISDDAGGAGREDNTRTLWTNRSSPRGTGY